MTTLSCGGSCLSDELGEAAVPRRRLLQRLVRHSSSATRHSLELFGVAIATHCNLCHFVIDVMQIVRREFN